MAKGKSFNYGKQVQELQKIVDQLESDDVEFEASLKLVEKGTQIINECETFLNDTELKLTKVTGGADGPDMEELPVGQD